MRLFLLLYFSLLAMNSVHGQGVLWQNCYKAGFFPGTTHYTENNLRDGQIHRNGGILAVGSHWGDVNGFGLSFFKTVRISASGDSLGTHRLPGFIKDGVSSAPSFIGRSQAGNALVFCPTDTFGSPLDSFPGLSYIAVLDTSGTCIDSFSLDAPGIHHSTRPHNGTQFSSTSAILTSPGYEQDAANNIYEVWHVWKIRIPEGYLDWHKTLRPNIYFAEGCKAVIMPHGTIWVYGVAGASIAVVKLDSLGNQTGFQILYTTPTSVKPTIGRSNLLPLPDGKLALSLYYSPLSPQYGSKPGASVLIVMDTLGNPIWQISKPVQYQTSPVNQFGQVYGANIDGSINYLRDSLHNGTSYSFLEKRAADSTLLYSWPLTTKGDTRAYEINGVVYAGNEQAYVYGNGGNYVTGQPGDYVAKVTGFGDPFVPTAIKAMGGPRASISAVLYPNPAQGFVQLQIEKAMPYKILTITGAVVQEGIASPKIPIDVAVLPPVLYQLILSDGQQKVVKRFVKN